MNPEIATIVIRGYGGVQIWEHGGRWLGCLLAPLNPRGTFEPLHDTVRWDWQPTPEAVIANLARHASDTPWSRRAAEPRCTVCGCTDDSACMDPGDGMPCHWVSIDPPLCSACARAATAQDWGPDLDTTPERNADFGRPPSPTHPSVAGA
jgi:hypothetical protein